MNVAVFVLHALQPQLQKPLLLEEFIAIYP